MKKSPPRERDISSEERTKERLYSDIIAMLTETDNLIKEVKVNKKYCYRLDSKIVGIHQTMLSFKAGPGKDTVKPGTYNKLFRLLIDIQEFLKISSVKHKTILGTFNKNKIQSNFESLNKRLLEIMIEEPQLLPHDDSNAMEFTAVGRESDVSQNSRKKRTKTPLLSISSISHDTHDLDDNGSKTSALLRPRSRSNGDANYSVEGIEKANAVNGNNVASSVLFSAATTLHVKNHRNNTPSFLTLSSNSSINDTSTAISMLYSTVVEPDEALWTMSEVLQKLEQASKQREESLAIETFDNLCKLLQYKESMEDNDSQSIASGKVSAKRLPSSPSPPCAESYEKLQQLFGDGGGCALFVSTFSALLWSVQVCESALRAVCYLTRFSQRSGTSNIENVTRLGEEGICPHIASTMNTYGRNLVLLYWASKSICNLTTDCVTNNIKFGESNLCPIIVTLLGSYGGFNNNSQYSMNTFNSADSLNSDDFDFSFEFSQQLWTCLINLSLCQENHPLLYSCGACETILSVWKSCFAQGSSSGTTNREIRIARQINLWGCMSIQNLALNDTLKTHLDALKPSVFKLAVAALSRYIEDMEVVLQGFTVVQNIANNNDKNNSLLGAAGACETVVRVLSHHVTEEIVAQRGCMALMNLSYNNERNRIILAKHGACEVIKKVLEIHLDREPVVEFAFGTIVNFTEDRNDLVLHKLSAAGVCEAIMPVFLLHCVDSRCDSVAELGGWAIKNLAMATQENSTILGAMGACEGITSALLGHMGNASVAEMCLWAMRALTSSENVTNCYRLGACGACEAVTSALKQHYSLEAVVEQGCGAVLNLAQFSKHNRALLSAADAYNVIVKAVKEMAGTNEDIELIGFGALSNLMRSDEGFETNSCSSYDHDEMTATDESVNEALTGLWVAVERRDEVIARDAIKNVTECAERGVDGIYQTPLGKGHVCEMLVHLVYPLLDSKDVVTELLQCICRLTRYGETKLTANEDNIVAFGKCGMSKVLVVGVERHFDTDVFDCTQSPANDIALTIWGCKALTYLASNMTNNGKLGIAGGCDLITRILYKYVKIECDMIVKYGWGAVINLSLWEENNLRLGDAGICECLYDYMLTWKDNMDSVTILLISVQNLALSALNRSRLGRAGACKLIMSIVDSYESAESVLEFALMAIQKLALDEENCEVMYGLKVCQFLVNTMQSFTDNEAIIELGSMAVMNISAGGNVDVVISLEDAGVADIFAKLLQKYSAHSEIVEYVLIAICNLVVCSGNPKLYGQTGIAESLALVIKNFAKSEVILEQACKSIVALLKNKENVIRLQQSHLQVNLSKALVALSHRGNKLRGMLERTRNMIKTGVVKSLTSPGNISTYSKDVPPSLVVSPTSSVGPSNTTPRPGPLRLEKSSSSSVNSLQSQSTYGSLPVNTPGGSIGASVTSKSVQQQQTQHTMTVAEVIVKLRKGIENVEESTSASSLRAMARMCEGNQAIQTEFGSSGACKLVLDALSTFLNSRSVAESGLRAVCFLSRYGQDKGTASDSNNRAFGEMNIPHMLVKVMQTHEESEKVGLYGCKAIMNLGTFETNNDMLGDAGACEVVVSVLDKFSSNTILLKQGLWAIINLALNKKNNARLTSLGCGMVVQILRKHAEDADISAWACMAVQNLCLNKTNQTQLGSMEAVEMVVKVMDGNIKDTTTIQFGLMAIEKLGQHIENSKRAGACGACELVLRSLQMFHGNEMIIELCWKCMNRLCNQCLDNCHRFVDNNSCDLLTSSLKKFSQTEPVVEQVLAAIGYLGGIPLKTSSGDGESEAEGEIPTQQVRTLLGNSGACEAVTNILTTYTSDEAIKKASQQQSDNIGIIFLCLQAVVALSLNEDDNRSRFGKCGACEKTIAAMTLHLGSEDIAIRGATVVLTLAKHHHSNAQKFTATGALTVMLRILQKNSSSIKVVVMGFSAMTTVLNTTNGDNESNAKDSKGNFKERAVTFGSDTKGESTADNYVATTKSTSARPTLRRDRRTGAVGIWEDAGSYDVIIKILRQHLSNKEISVCGCQLLHSMMHVCATSVMNVTSSGNVGTGRGVHLPPRAVSSIGDILNQLLNDYHESSSRVASLACQTVTDMLADPRSCAKHSSLLGKVGICDSLLTCMDSYIVDNKQSTILEKILLSLANLCSDRDNRAFFGEKLLCEKMVRLCFSDIDSETLVCASLQVIAALAVDSCNHNALYNSKAADLAMQVLEKHQRNVSIMSHVCAMVSAVVQDKLILSQMDTLKLHVWLITTLESHLRYAAVSMEACRAIHSLCNQNSKYCIRMVEAGACGVLLKVVLNYADYYRPQSIIYASQTLNLLCQADDTLSSRIHKGLFAKEVEDINGIGFVLCNILKMWDNYSPRGCRSSSFNLELHESVPVSSVLKREQNVQAILSISNLLFTLGSQCPSIITDLFPGDSQVAPWLMVTTPRKSSEPHDFLKILTCVVMKNYMDEGLVVTLLMQLIYLVFCNCPHDKRYFGFQEKYEQTSYEELWLPVVSDAIQVYLSTKNIFVLGTLIVKILLQSAAESVMIRSPPLLAALEIDGLVKNTISGLSTYLTDTPVLLELVPLVQHLSRISQFSPSFQLLANDLRTCSAAEKVIRVLQVHQHDDDEHKGNSASRSSMTDTQIQAVQLCIDCCQCLLSFCEQSESENIRVGSSLGFCEIACSLLEYSLLKSTSKNKKEAKDGANIYMVLRDVSCSTVTHLIAAETNRQIAMSLNLRRTICSTLLSHHKIASVADCCCRSLLYLVPRGDGETTSEAVNGVDSCDSSVRHAPSVAAISADIKNACNGAILALNYHANDEAFIQSACWAVTHLATNSAHRRLLGTLGAGELILRLLSINHEKVDLLEILLGALINLVDNDVLNRNALIENSVVLQVAALFENFSALQNDHHYVLCELLCMATINLTETNVESPDTNKIIASIGKTTVPNSVLSMISQIPSPASQNSTRLLIAQTTEDDMATTLIKQGCWVLKNLTLRHPHNARILGEMGVCATLVPVVQSYIQCDAQVAEFSCAVLVGLLTCDMSGYCADLTNSESSWSNLDELCATGGFDVAIQILFAYTGSQSVSAVQTACYLLYRMMFLTVVKVDAEAKLNVQDAELCERDYHNEDNEVQNALDSFATIQHVMEEALKLHATQSFNIADRTIRILRHLYFRTFRTCPQQFRSFSTWLGNSRNVRHVIPYVVESYGKSHREFNELREHHGRLVLSDWLELSHKLGPLLLCYKKSNTLLQQILRFITELCDSAAHAEIQSSFSTDTLKNVLLIVRHYFDAIRCSRESIEFKESFLFVIDDCFTCLVSLMDNNSSNKQSFLNIGGGDLLLELLNYLLKRPGVDDNVKAATVAFQLRESTLLLTNVSRVLLILLWEVSDREVDEFICDEQLATICIQNRFQLVNLGIHVPLVRLCLCAGRGNLPVSSQNLFMPGTMKCSSANNAGASSCYCLKDDFNCEFGSSFEPRFLSTCGRVEDYPFGTSVVLPMDEAVLNGCEVMGGKSTLIACIHAMDVLRSLILPASQEADDTVGTLANSCYDIFKSSLNVVDCCGKKISLVEAIVSRLEELGTCEKPTESTSTRSRTSHTVVPMSCALTMHLRETLFQAGQELFSEYLLGFLNWVHPDHIETIFVVPNSSSAKGKEHASSSIKTHPLASAIVHTFQLLGRCASSPTSSASMISCAAIMVVEAIVAITINLGKVSAQGGLGRELCLVPSSNDDVANRTKRRNVLLALVSRQDLFAVMPAVLERVPIERAKGVTCTKTSLKDAALTELKHYLLRG